VATHPEGDLLAYFDSLRRTLDLGPSALYPGHGPELTRDPAAVIEYYVAHREYRQRQVLAAIADGAAEVGTRVQRIYGDVDRRLWPFAEQSTWAALVKLRREGRITF
jgi:glyoxylase-like metal-dependent hydrolase (beta-lactamase superfamily II)